jgi:hypothetical protein
MVVSFEVQAIFGSRNRAPRFARRAQRKHSTYRLFEILVTEIPERMSIPDFTCILASQPSQRCTFDEFESFALASLQR